MWTRTWNRCRSSCAQWRRPACSRASTPTTSTPGCSGSSTGGPWPTIASHHFESVDELIATVTGVVPKDHGLTLDDIASPQFRGFFGQNSVCFHPELNDCFYNAASSTW